MPSPYDADITDAAGTVRISGAVDFTDPDNQPGGGAVPYVSGEGSPVDAVTPTAGKPLYVDTDTGTLYLATGATSADWLVFGVVAGNVGEATGLAFFGVSTYLLSGDRDDAETSVYVGSTYAQWNGHGQGLHMEYGASEGLETYTLSTGSTGQHIAQLLNGDGQTTFPGETIVEGALVVALNDGAGLDTLASQAAIWFDDDNTVPALRIRARTANGTVVTGQILLT